MYDWIEVSLKYQTNDKGSLKGIIPVGRSIFLQYFLD